MPDGGKQTLARFLRAAQRFAVSAGAGTRRIPDWTGRHRSAIGNVALHLLALGLTAYVFLTLNRRYYLSGIGFDESFFVWGGWSIKKGLTPYRDFLEFKPPMLFITHYFAQALFRKELGFRTFFTVFPLVSVLALQISLVRRGIGRFFAAAVMAGFVSLFVGGNWHDSSLSDSESIGVSYYLLGLACLLWEGRFIKATTALGGAFLACCVLSKEPFGLVVVFTWVAVFWLRGRGEPSRESSKLYAQYSLLGVWLLILALCVYMVPTGAMKGYLHLLLIDYRKIYGDPAHSYCVLLGAGSSAATGDFLLDSGNRIRSTFLNENILGYLLPLLLPGAVFTYRRSKALLALSVLVFVGALAAPPMSRCMWHHYYIMSMAGVAFALVVAADSMKLPLRGASPPFRRATTIALMLLVGLHAAPEITKERKGDYKREPWGEPQSGLLAFINANTTPSDRIFTTGPPILYVKANRLSAARESCYVDPILGSYDGTTDAEKLRPIYRELVKNKPKVVFLDPQNGDLKPRTNAALLRPFLDEFKYKKINDQLYLRP